MQLLSAVAACSWPRLRNAVGMQLRHAVGTCDARELRTRARPEKKGEQNISREGKIEIEIEIER